MTTAYHEQSSATRISGTIVLETSWPESDCVKARAARSTIAHWITKQISAMVATERPTIDARQPGVEQDDALDVGARQDRAEGAAEDIGRAQQDHELEPEHAARRCTPSEMAVQREPQPMLTTLTTSRKLHQTATGFDHASQSKFIASLRFHQTLKLHRKLI